MVFFAFWKETPAMERTKRKIKTTPPARKSKKRLSKNSKLGSFFVDELRQLYWTERRLLKSLPKSSKGSTTAELKAILDNHCTVTEGHVACLDKVFLLIGRKARPEKSEGMSVLIRNFRNATKHNGRKSMTRDVDLILAAQKVEHCKIASYNTLVHIAGTMGHPDVAKILVAIADEERAADHVFSLVGKSTANVEASLEQD